MSQPPNYPNGQQPNNQSGFYNQPTSQYRQPGQLLPGRPPSPNKKPDHSQRNAWIIIGAILVLGLLIGTIVSATQGTQTPTAQATPTDTPTQDTSLLALTPTDTPADYPTDTPTPTDTPQPTATPTPHPAIQPTATPRPQPTPTPHHTGVNGNPWGYDFNPGGYITYPPSGFCNYFNCIATFYASDDPGDGYVVECQDGTYSQSGGESGACSSHGGVMRPLYSH